MDRIAKVPRKTYAIGFEMPLDGISSAGGCNIFHDAIGFENIQNLFLNLCPKIKFVSQARG